MRKTVLLGMAAVAAVSIAPTAFAQKAVVLPAPPSAASQDSGQDQAGQPEAMPLYEGAATAVVSIDASGEITSCTVRGEGPLADEVRKSCSPEAVRERIGTMPDVPGPMDMEISVSQTWDDNSPQLLPSTPGFEIFMTFSIDAVLTDTGEVKSCKLRMAMPILPGMKDMDMPCEPGKAPFTFEMPEGHEDMPMPETVHMKMQMATNPPFTELMGEGEMPK